MECTVLCTQTSSDRENNKNWLKLKSLSKLKLDNFNKDVVRSTLHSMIQDKVFVTLKKLKRTLADD